MSVGPGNPDFLTQAIESILGQSFGDFEFVIVDDRADSRSKEILESFAEKDQRIRIIRNLAPLGLTRSLNKGLKQCQGKYVARMDADDVAYKDRLRIQFDFMESHPEIALCGSDVVFIDEAGREIGKKRVRIDFSRIDEIKKRMFRGNFLTHSTFFFRRDVIEDLGGYDAQFKRAQDYELLLRLLERYRIFNIPRFLLKYRVVLQGISQAKMKEQELYALKARLKALFRLGYPKWWILLLWRPVISLLVPRPVKLKALSASIKNQVIR